MLVSDLPVTHNGRVRVAAVQLEAGGAGAERRARRQGRAAEAVGVLRLLVPDGSAGEERGAGRADDDDDLPATGSAGPTTGE